MDAVSPMLRTARAPVIGTKLLQVPLVETALNRRPAAEERAILRRLYEGNLKRFRADDRSARGFLSIGETALPAGANPVQLAAMTIVTRAVLNVHELITRN